MQREGILVAVRPVAVEAAQAALQGSNLPLVFTHSLQDARSKLEQQQFQLILGTLQFDDSRLFDLWSMARSRSTPLVAIKLTESQLPDYVIDAFFRAAELLGFDGCMDVHRLAQQCGEDQALDRLLALIERTRIPR